MATETIKNYLDYSKYVETLIDDADKEILKNILKAYEANRQYLNFFAKKYYQKNEKSKYNYNKLSYHRTVNLRLKECINLLNFDFNKNTKRIISNNVVKIINADSCEYLTNLDSSTIKMCITGLPYPDMKIWSGDKIISSEGEHYFTFFDKVFKNIYRCLTNDGIFVFIINSKKDKEFYFRLINYLKSLGFIFEDTFLWVKKNITSGKFKKPQDGYDFIGVMKKSKFSIKYNLDFYTKNFNYFSEIATKVIVTTTSEDRFYYEVLSENKDLKIHSGKDPLKVFEFFIKLFVSPGDTVLDPFSGTGTCGIACADNGVNYIGVEKNVDNFNLTKEIFKKLNIIYE